MNAPLFLVFVVGWAAVLVATVDRWHGHRTAVLLAAGLVLWLTYVGTLSRLGVVADANRRPPGIVFVVGPLLVALAWTVRSRSAAGVAAAVPLPLLIGLQGFRVVVEWFLHRLWLDGLVPRTLTWAGDNVDLWTGLSAPLFAWIATRGPVGRRIAIAWNVVGLATLANVVVRSASTAPGPLDWPHDDVVNRAIGTFPYTFIAGFFAPSALLLHVLCLRAPRERPALAGSRRTAGT